MPTRYPGLWYRRCIYALAATAVTWALLTLPADATELTPLEVAGATAAVTAGFLFPIGSGRIGLWRSRRCFVGPGLVFLALTSSVQLTVLAWAVAAVVSGLWIRRGRFTPGRMAFGSSMVTVAATAGAAAMSALEGTPLAIRAAVGVVVLQLVWHVIRALMAVTAMGHDLRAELVDLGMLRDPGADLVGLAIGVGAVLLRDVSPVASLLLALPFAATIVARLHVSMLERVRRRERAVAEYVQRLRSATTRGEIESLMVDATCAVLDTPTARVGLRPPRSDELGVRWHDGWLVAGDRRAAPTFGRPYEPHERADLDMIVTAATAAVENLQLVDQLEATALQDGLTGLPNRRAAEELLEASAARARRRGEHLVVIALEIDSFRALVSAHGHPATDRVVATVADRLRAATRAEETLARWGGDAFLAVLVAAESATGARVAERLRAAASSPVALPGGHTVDVTLSAGVAVVSPGTLRSVEQALAEADIWLYRAAGQGGNRTVHAGGTVGGWQLGDLVRQP